VAGADAAGAYFYASNGTLTNRFYLLQVGMPCTTCFVVCMADIIPEAGTFSTYCTYFGHKLTP
jgi:hypothetical protein